MTNRENLIEALEGRKPKRIPFTGYADMNFSEITVPKDDLAELVAGGFALAEYTGVVSETAPNVERLSRTGLFKGKEAVYQTLRTPVGEITQVLVNNWVQEFFLKTPQDYKVMEYVVRNVRLEPDYNAFYEAEKRVGDSGITLIWGRRTPIQTILVDFAGLESFSYQMADFPEVVESLYEALLDQLLETYRIIAAGPGRYVHLLENMTAEAWGPIKFARYHMPAYDKAIALLHDAGKKVYAHFDGKLKCVAHLAGKSAIDGFESFTLPPEGDMLYAEARDNWPDKFIWSNISVGLYSMVERELRSFVRKAVQDAAPDGRNFAMAVLEDIPADWKIKLPIILDELDRIKL